MRRVAATCLLSLFVSAAVLWSAEPVAFRKTEQILREGDKNRSREVALVFLDDRLQISNRKQTQVFEEIPYSSISNVVYERSTHPRWKTAIFVSPLWLLSKGKKHWLTVTYGEDEGSGYVLLKLDKKEYQAILATVESRAQKKVERMIED